MSSSLKACLFDFDLTLADSSEGIIECARTALSQMRFPVPDPQRIRESIGLPLDKSFVFLTGDRDQTLAETYARNFVACADEVMVAMTHFYPPVETLLKTLRVQQVRVGIVSTKFRYRIEAILRHAGLEACVDVVIGGEDVTRHKPDPEGLQKALEILAIPASDAVYVGDHQMDAQAAQAAGTRFVGAVTGLTDFEAWQAQGQASVRHDLSELLSVVGA
ncbi:phosphoglycolate phosphatase [Paraburkholderia phenazinium]|uniref:phosphoglycolate phosphatase n=1 Tax=Paraburkholderia phenazinium TaxID=60549 RepID=A0A1G8JF91_9BURK|nr:phosphoglycolate phosphatase [Paraburkholderia phenazinium]